MHSLQPVLYLDIDDTLVSWASGRPVAAAHASDFVTWALRKFEVRWLTTWCPGGRMPESLATDLANLLHLPVERLRQVQGLDWTASGCKLDGIAWLEHLVWKRPFVWLEDDRGFGERERRFLDRLDLIGSYCHCNVTRDAGSLGHAWQALRQHQLERTIAA